MSKPKTRWRKSPHQLIEQFDSCLPADPRVERRTMFGYPCAFAAGQLFTGLHQESLMVRLPLADREKALAEHGATPFEPMPGRGMREYVVLPEAIVRDRAALSTWMAMALAYALSLPPKAAKDKRKASGKRR